MSQKKVLFIANIPSPYRVDFFSELGKYCELTVCFEGKTATDRDDKWKPEEKNNYKSITLKGIRTGIGRFFCPGILKYINKEWDCIVIAGYSSPTQMLAIEKARMKRIPFYIEADGGFLKDESGFSYIVKKHFISSASAWITSGKITNDYFAYYGADKNKCYIYPFTSLREQDLIGAGEKCGKDKQYYRQIIGAEEEFVVLTVGRFTYNNGYGKGYDVIMNVAEKSPNIGFYIVGGEPTDEFSKWKEEKKLVNVHFIGFKTKKELENYYLAANVFTLMTRGDVWGLVVNEAMMYGLPIITTTTCGAAFELVKEDINGYVISIDEQDKLKEVIDEYYVYPEKCKSHGLESLQIIQNYTIEKMAKAHMDIFEKSSL